MSADPYKNIVGVYDRIFEPMNKGLRLLGFRMFPVNNGKSVLDIGCGTGVHLKIYQDAGCEVYGVDSSPSMLEASRKQLGDSADLRLGSAEKLPYESGTFDVVICMLVLHEMSQSERLNVLRDIKRVLKDSGYILIIDFHAGPARPLKGWLAKLFIFLSEVAAGRRHFRNYRHFISIGGLPKLIEQSQLSIVQNKIVAGGAMALYLVQDSG